ncbi:MAG: hypothetical protein Q9226_007698, partial [Calogaya cf. arnoldii]
ELALNFLEPMPHPFKDDVVYVAIDVEAAERQYRTGPDPADPDSWVFQGDATEIGVAVLDTRDIAPIPPGSEYAENWLTKAKWVHHIRVEELLSHRLEKYGLAGGDPTNFLQRNFGNRSRPATS